MTNQIVGMNRTDLARAIICAIAEQNTVGVYPGHQKRMPFSIEDDELDLVLVDGDVDFLKVADRLLEARPA